MDIAKDLQDGQLPDIKYHGQCHSLFTMKREIEKLEKQESTVLQNHDNSMQSSRKSSVYDSSCIFCEKQFEYLKLQDS